MANGPSEHLSWAELACRDGSPYPLHWRMTRAVPLAAAFERIRELCGFPLVVNSAYRSFEHNRAIGGAGRSMHVEGLALDLHPARGGAAAMRKLTAAARAEYDARRISGLGIYPAFVHVDIRPGRAANWAGGRPAEAL